MEPMDATARRNIVPNIKIYGLPLTSPLGLELERLLLTQVPRTPGWEGRHVSSTVVDSREDGTLRLEVAFMNRIGLEPDAVTGLKMSVATIARDFLDRHRGGHPFRRIVVRMQPTQPECYEIVELKKPS